MSRSTSDSDLSTFAVVVIEPQAVQLVAPLGEDDALSLMECLSEDPADWRDLMLVWPRYRFDQEQPEFASAFPRRELTLDDAIAACAKFESWVALDLVQKRVLTSPSFPAIEWIRRGAGDDGLGTTRSDDDSPADFFCVLPGWWELVSATSGLELGKSRLGPSQPPRAFREVLWGRPLLRTFTAALLARALSDPSWLDLPDDQFPSFVDESVVAEHREWLLTPRSDLAGGTPRDCLHGGKDWIDALIHGQMPHLESETGLIPVPAEFSGYVSAPPGSHEVIMYFHACRELLIAGWDWIQRHAETLAEGSTAVALHDALGTRLADWLQESFEGGPSPAEIIRCERGRIPLVSDGESHTGDCDCPLCEMMAEGMFGPTVTGYDGHELELDDDFAFSLCRTREEWEEQRQEWGELDPDDSSDEATSARLEADDPRVEEDDALQSPWRHTYVSDEMSTAGGPQAHVAAAFFLAELVSTLKQLGAPQSDVDRLNRTFRNFRKAETPESFAAAGVEWVETLETLAIDYPDLVGRSADLQSRVVEQLRAMAHGLNREGGEA